MSVRYELAPHGQLTNDLPRRQPDPLFACGIDRRRPKEMMVLSPFIDEQNSYHLSPWQRRSSHPQGAAVAQDSLRAGWSAVIR